MKYLISILCIFCSIYAFAQRGNIIPYQDKMEDNINAAYLKFKNDSLQIMMRANKEIEFLKESLSKEVIKEKEQYAKQILSDIPASIELGNVENFISSLMSKSENLSEYLDFSDDIKRINAQLEGFDIDTFRKFNTFITELGVLERSIYILNNLTPKEEVAENLSAISKSKFYTLAQVKSIEPIISSLKKYNSAKMYMSSMLETVKESYNTYKATKETESPTKDINDELTFDLSVATISSVPCMDKIFKRLTCEVIVYRQDHSFDFDKFNIQLLDELIDELNGNDK